MEVSSETSDSSQPYNATCVIRLATMVRIYSLTKRKMLRFKCTYSTLDCTYTCVNYDAVEVVYCEKIQRRIFQIY